MRRSRRPSSSRGLAVGDLWNDGKISAVISNMNAVPSLLVNQVRNANHWIAIHTVGTKSNRDGIGARIRVKAGARILVDEVRSGSSYISNSDMRVHFGLGKADKIEWIEIRWPNGMHRAVFESAGGSDSHAERRYRGRP